MAKEQFIKCPVRVIKDKEMSNEAARLYMTMIYLAWEQSTRGGKADELVMTNKVINEYIGGDAHKAIKAVKELVAKGYINKGKTKTKAGDYANKYVILSTDDKPTKDTGKEKSAVNVATEPIDDKAVSVADDMSETNDDIKVNDMGNYIGKLEDLDIAKNSAVEVKGAGVASPVSIAPKEENKVKESPKVVVKAISEPKAVKSPAVPSAAKANSNDIRERAEVQRQLIGDPSFNNIGKWVEYWEAEDERLGRDYNNDFWLKRAVRILREDRKEDPFERNAKAWRCIDQKGDTLKYLMANAY